jgi:hypothetical protein
VSFNGQVFPTPGACEFRSVKWYLLECCDQNILWGLKLENNRWREGLIVDKPKAVRGRRGAKPMKKALAFILLILLALTAPVAWGQGAAAKSRGAASLPPTCAVGGANTAPDTIVVNSVYYVCTATNTWTPMHSQEADNTWTNNNRFCGPNPWADISCFGARAPAGGAPSTTATCVKGSNQVAIAGQNTFQVNDGVTIYGCGATNSMATPTELKVTPSEPWGLADTRSAVAGPEGSSVYEYTVVARDIYGALTAPATPVAIKTGQASLDLQRASLRTLSRTNDRITVVTAEPNRLVVGALVELEPKNSA